MMMILKSAVQFDANLFLEFEWNQVLKNDLCRPPQDLKLVS